MFDSGIKKKLPGLSHFQFINEHKLQHNFTKSNSVTKSALKTQSRTRLYVETW